MISAGPERTGPSASRFWGLVERGFERVVSVSFHTPELAMMRDAKQRSQLSMMKWTQIFVMWRTMGDGVWLQQLRKALGR